MPRVRVKICGITNHEDARLAVEQGADAVGLILAESPRRVDISTAREITDWLPPYVTRVGVFKDQEVRVVWELMDVLRLDYAQLHGSESPRFCSTFSRRAIKVFQLTGPEVLQQIRQYETPIIMLDVPKGRSGSVLRHGAVVQQAAREGRIILAGGLTPDNVKEAILRFRPFAVDVASGVETYPGKKDERKVIDFFRQVREAEDALSTTG